MGWTQHIPTVLLRAGDARRPHSSNIYGCRRQYCGDGQTKDILGVHYIFWREVLQKRCSGVHLERYKTRRMYNPYHGARRQFDCRFETFSRRDLQGKTIIRRAVNNATTFLIIFLSIFFVSFLFDSAFRGSTPR